jgi:hypothetical protein
MGLALATLLVLQDADALIRALGDDAIQTRDAALAELVKLGTRALPKIEAALAASTDPEVLARLKKIKELIRLNENLRAALGPTARVTLKVDGAALEDVLERINKQGTGDKATCEPALRGRRVKFNAADLPYFEALQALCVQNEGIYLQVSHAEVLPLGNEKGLFEVVEKNLLVRAGVCIPAATVCSGPFIVQADQFRTTRSINGRGRQDLEVWLNVKSQANVHPLSAGVILEGFPEEADHDDWYFKSKSEASAWRRGHRFENKGEIAEQPARLDLKGRAVFYFPNDFAPWLVDIPAAEEKEESRLILDDSRFTLIVKPNSDGVSVSLEITDASGQEGQHYWNCYARAFMGNAIEFLDSDGRVMAVKHSGNTWATGGAMRSLGKTFTYPALGGRPSRVRVTLPKSFHMEVVPFEMKGLPLR